MQLPDSRSFSSIATIPLQDEHVLHPDACNPAADTVVLFSVQPSRPGGGGAGPSRLAGGAQAVTKTKVELWRILGTKVWEYDPEGQVVGFAWHPGGRFGKHLTVLVARLVPGAGPAPKVFVQHLVGDTGALHFSVMLDCTLDDLGFDTGAPPIGYWVELDWRPEAPSHTESESRQKHLLDDELALPNPVKVVPAPKVPANPFARQVVAPPPRTHPSLNLFPRIFDAFTRAEPATLCIFSRTTGESHVQLYEGSVSVSAPVTAMTERIVRQANRVFDCLEIMHLAVEAVEGSWKEATRQTMLWREELESCGAKHGLSPRGIHADLFQMLMIGYNTPPIQEWFGKILTPRAVEKWHTTVIDALKKLGDIVRDTWIPAAHQVVVWLETLRGDTWGWILRSGRPGWAGEKGLTDALRFAADFVKLLRRLEADVEHERMAAEEFLEWVKFEVTRPETAPNQPPVPMKFDLKLTWSYMANGFVNSKIDDYFPVLSAPDAQAMVSKDFALGRRGARPPIDSLLGDLLQQETGRDAIQSGNSDKPLGSEHDISMTSANEAPNESDMSMEQTNIYADRSAIAPEDPSEVADQSFARAESPDEDDRDTPPPAEREHLPIRRPDLDVNAWAVALTLKCHEASRAAMELNAPSERQVRSSRSRYRLPTSAMDAKRLVEEDKRFWTAGLTADGSQVILVVEASDAARWAVRYSLGAYRCEALSFFDDEELALLLSSGNDFHLVTVRYADAFSEGTMHHIGQRADREHGLDAVERQLRDFPDAPLPISRCRGLYRGGEASTGSEALALNGRPNRRIGCALLAAGKELAVLDFDTNVDEEEGEEEEDAEAEGMEV